MVKGGYRSRFTENKTALSQFKKNIKLAFHASWKIKEHFGESRFTAAMKITIHQKKRAISHFTGNKEGRSRVTKIPFTTLREDTDQIILSNGTHLNRLLYADDLALISHSVEGFYAI